MRRASGAPGTGGAGGGDDEDDDGVEQTGRDGDVAGEDDDEDQRRDDRLSGIPRRRPGSYGRFGLLLVPVWLVAVGVVIDLARRLGGPVAWVALAAGGVVSLALLAFAVIWFRARGS